MEEEVQIDHFYRQYQIIFGVFVAMYVILNFLGSPILKWNYLAIVGLTIIGVAKYQWQRIIVNVFILFFIEGQGRILLNYSGISKVIFDLVIIIAIIKSYIVHKKVIPLKVLPNFLYITISLHIAWYIFQIFNPDAASSFSVIGASKIYVFPFLMFFTFLMNPLDKETLTKLQWTVLFISLIEVILSTYQMSLQESFLNGIAPYYATIMSDRFTGINFRPFGTTYAPGGPAPYLAYFSAMLLIVGYKKVTHKLVSTAIILWCIFGLYIMQVRSALVKYVLILLTILLAKNLLNKKNIKTSIGYSLGFLLIASIGFATVDIQKLFPSIDFTQAQNRFQMLIELENMEDARGGRITFDKALNVIFRKLDQNPIGLGPGRTGGAVSLAKSKILADPVYGIKSTWTFDNLFISLAIDLGWGMIFYTFTILTIPLYLFYKTIILYFRGKGEEITPAAISSISLFVLILGNWGVIGIPYNPESFTFWLWCSIGLHTVYKIENTNYSIKEEEEAT